MGLLDDAIREHLELKRRRGADPDEVARQEDEALGDPRSGEFARPGEDEPVAAVAAAEDLPPEPPEPAAYEPEPEPESEPEPPDEAWLEEEDERAEFEPPHLEPAPEVVRPDDEPGADEDVLEETPDFLQETPEHDRLWFEQKPPRDFDFDN
jgi:hypothetical protein